MGFAALNPSYIAKDVDGRNKSGHDEMKAHITALPVVVDRQQA